MAELGNKHECSECGAKFYDLGRPAAVCPKCGTDQKTASDAKANAEAAKKAAKAAKAAEEAAKKAALAAKAASKKAAEAADDKDLEVELEDDDD